MNSTVSQIPNSPEPTLQQNPSSSRDDWFCAICMDYLNDAVQTSCSHKFCRFCIDRWITVNPSRLCPICRSPVGRILELADLNATILTFLSSNLTPEEIEQRQRIQQQRASSRNSDLLRTLFPNPRSALTEASTASSFENVLVQTAIENSLLAAERGLHIRQMQRWPTLRGSITSTYPVSASTAAARSRTQSSGPAPLFEPQPNNRAGRQTDEQMQRNLDSTRRNLEETRRALLQIIEREHSADNHRSRSQSPVSSVGQSILEDNDDESEIMTRGRETLFRNVVEDVLINEYNYHLRRVESAFSRLQAARRDLNYHSEEMRAIYGSFVAHQNTQAQDTQGSENQSTRLRLTRSLREPPRLNVTIVPSETEVMEALRNARNGVAFSLSRTPTVAYNNDAHPEEEEERYPIFLTESRGSNPMMSSQSSDDDDDTRPRIDAQAAIRRILDLDQESRMRRYSFASVLPSSQEELSQASEWESIASSFHSDDGIRPSSGHVPAARQRFNRCRRSASFRSRSSNVQRRRMSTDRRFSETSGNELTAPSILTIEETEVPLEAATMNPPLIAPSNACSNIVSYIRNRNFSYSEPLSSICISESDMNAMDALNNNFEAEESGREVD